MARRGPGSNSRRSNPQEDRPVLISRLSARQVSIKAMPRARTLMAPRSSEESPAPTLHTFLARERGRSQLGTLGAGNHFIEVDTVTEVYDENIAARLDIYPGNVAMQIHRGSRGLGH